MSNQSHKTLRLTVMGTSLVVLAMAAVVFFSSQTLIFRAQSTPTPPSATANMIEKCIKYMETYGGSMMDGTSPKSMMGMGTRGGMMGGGTPNHMMRHQS